MSTTDPAATDSQTAAPSSRPRVAILFGGRSSEHSISLVTARGVLGAIDREHWDVVTVGIARTGEWFLFSPEQLEALLEQDPITELPVGHEMVSLPMGSGDTELLIRDISGEGPAQERRWAHSGRQIHIRSVDIDSILLRRPLHALRHRASARFQDREEARIHVGLQRWRLRHVDGRFCVRGGKRRTVFERR